MKFPSTACSAALAGVFKHKELVSKIIQDRPGPIVLEICGGSAVTFQILTQWINDFQLSSDLSN
jgi:cobyric acid synthase